MKTLISQCQTITENKEIKVKKKSQPNFWHYVKKTDTYQKIKK